MALVMASRFRRWTALLVVFPMILATGLAFDPDPYKAQVYAGVRAIAPLPVWAAAWTLIAVTALWTTVTLAVWAWRFTSVAAIAVATVWASALIWSHVVNGAPTPRTILALWVWFVVSLAYVSTSNLQFEVDHGAG